MSEWYCFNEFYKIITLFFFFWVSYHLFRRHLIRPTMEVQLSFVCSTKGKGSKPRMWNMQNLGAEGSGTEEGVAVAATGTQS